MQAGVTNSGHACVAGTRILVPASRMADFIERARAEATRVRVGDPRDPIVSVGPIASQKQWDRVQRYIGAGLAEGATLLAGGEGKPTGLEAGYFVKPTLFADVTNTMTNAREEIFGPVLCMLSYTDEAQPVALANDTPYGLQAYVLSSDSTVRTRSRIVSMRDAS